MSSSKPLFEYNPPDHRYLCVVYKDLDLLVLSKPAGLLSVPGRGKAYADSLQTRVLAAYPKALLVHRLDLATSGLMVMALKKKAQSHLGKHFEKRMIDKTYVALVQGVMQDDEGIVDMPLCVDWPNRPRQKVDFENGRPAQTHWRVLEQGEDYTRVELKPVTGRAHQLRVHMLSLGHPIIGDPLYATQTAAPRMFLHAQTLTLHHPRTGELVTFEDRPEF